MRRVVVILYRNTGLSQLSEGLPRKVGETQVYYNSSDQKIQTKLGELEANIW